MTDLLLQDLRYGLRQLLRSPAFTLTAILTLALGIGANTIIFGMVNGLLLRPVPVDRPDRLVAMYAIDYRSGETRQLSYPEYLDYRDRSGAFAGLAAQQGAPVNLRVGDRADVVWSEIVSENYFSVLGLSAVLGRTFQPPDVAGPGSAPLVVLSHRLWLSRFGGAGDIVGKQVTINGFEFTVVGVAPAGFRGMRKFGFWPELWVPLAMHAQIMPGSEGLLENRVSTWLEVFGRLKPGLSPSATAAATADFAARLAQAYPETNRERGNRLLSARTGFDDPDGFPPQVILLSAGLAMGGVGLILLLACANVANLLLARASTRGREVAVRLALGASRGRLLRQFLTESLLLALAGGVAGVGLTLWSNEFQQLMIPRLQFQVGFDTSPDLRVLAFALAISVLTALLFGLAPGLHATRPDVALVLKDQGARLVRGRLRPEARSLLAVAQVSLSLILLIGGGLFLKSLLKARTLEPGLAREHRLLLSLNTGLQGYDEQRGREFYRQLIAGVQELPGVASATLSFPLPLDTYGRSRRVFVANPTDKRLEDGINVGTGVIGFDYFATVGTPLVMGRDFRVSDTAGAEGSAIINQEMARRFWGRENPIGQEFRLGAPDGPLVSVVGVAQDGKYGMIGEGPRPYMYLPLAQDYQPGSTLVVRSHGDPAALIPSVRDVVRRLDPNLGTFGIMTMRQHLESALNLPTISAMLAGAFAVVALLLAVVGIYGVISYSVARRTREVGIRVALGARSRDVLRLVLSNGLGLAAAGVAIGLAVALGVSRLIGGMLYDVSSRDLTVFITVPVLLTAVVLFAAYLPARRASRVDPVIALRSE